MMKQILAAACAMAMMLTGAAMAETDVRVTALKGPTAMGMAALMNEAESGAVNGNDYAFTIASAVDEVSPKLVKGETDIAAVPANLASVLYQNTKGEVQVLAVNTLGVLYICELGDTVNTVADLRGKTIFSAGKGATPEYALEYVLRANGLDPTTDVTIEWKSEHAECLAALLAEENAVAMLPQPFVTTAQMKSNTALSMRSPASARRSSSLTSSLRMVPCVAAHVLCFVPFPKGFGFLSLLICSLPFYDCSILYGTRKNMFFLPSAHLLMQNALLRLYLLK